MKLNIATDINSREYANEPLCDGFGCEEHSVQRIKIQTEKFGEITLSVCEKCFNKLSKIQQVFNEMREK